MDPQPHVRTIEFSVEAKIGSLEHPFPELEKARREGWSVLGITACAWTQKNGNGQVATHMKAFLEKWY
jgi:hypothetical protein